MDAINNSFLSLDSQLAWVFVLAGVALLIMLQPKGKRLRSVPLWLAALVLAYLICELHLPILQFLVLALALFAVAAVGLIWWIVKRLHKVAETLYNAQEAYRQNQDKAAYLAALEQCSKQLRAVKWLGKRATIRKQNGPGEMKFWDYLEQQKRALQDDDVIDI